MRYNFFSKNSDLNFIIKNNKEFKKLMEFLEIYIPDVTKRIMSKLKKSNVVQIDKYTTKRMYEELESDLESRDEFEVVDDMLQNMRTEMNVLVTLYLIQFQRFIRRTRGGFIIHRN